MDRETLGWMSTDDLRPLARLLVLAVVTFASFAASASAATICVPDARPGRCDSVQATIQGAVDVAAVGDTVRIAAGVYEEAVDAGAKTLTFEGAGADATVIGPAWAHDGPALPGLSMPRGGSVRSLRVVGGTVMAGSGSPGLVFTPDVDGTFQLSLSHASVRGGSGDFAAADGLVIGATRPRMAGASIEDSFVQGGTAYGSGGRGIVITGSGTGPVTIEGSELKGGYGRPGEAPGLVVSGASAASLRVSEITGGVAVSASSLTVGRSTLAGNTGGSTPGGGSAALSVSGPSSVSLSDSVLSARPAPANRDLDTAAVIVSGSSAGTTSLTVRGTTIFAGAAGSDPDAGVLVRRSATDALVGAELRNSVVRLEGSAHATDAELVADGAHIAADFSAFSTVRALNGGSVPTPGAAHNVSGNPRFTSAASGDFTLLAASPMIDRGDPAVVTAGQLDRAGHPRSTDGDGDCLVAPDLGAFETPEACGPPLISAFSMTHRVFAPLARSTTARRHVKRGTRFRYTLSEAGTVTITIDRRRPGRDRRVGVLRSREQAGRQSLRFSGRLRGRTLRPARYRARAVAIDRQGARSRPRRLTFRIVR